MTPVSAITVTVLVETTPGVFYEVLGGEDYAVRVRKRRLEEVAVPGTRGHTEDNPDRCKLTINDIHILYSLDLFCLIYWIHTFNFRINFPLQFK